jgi:threonine/homoserine/homoserine lactone efflux protein
MYDNLQAILLFAASAAFTPGPNNLMITASGTNFGYWRSLPHMLGVTFGFPAMLVAMAFGLMQLFEIWPVLHKILRYAGAAYMIYLAFRIATSTSLGKAQSKGHPLRFLEAALFQWINPKAVIFALSAVSMFTTPDGNFIFETMFLAGIAVLVSFSSISTWCLFGTAIGHYLKSPKALRFFNFTMAGTLVASITLIFK